MNVADLCWLNLSFVYWVVEALLKKTAVCLPSQKARSAFVCVYDIQTWILWRKVHQAEGNIVRGRDHRQGPKEAAGTYIEEVFRFLFVEEWHQRPRCRESPKSRTTFGSGCLGYFCFAELFQDSRKSQDRRGAHHGQAKKGVSGWTSAFYASKVAEKPQRFADLLLPN